MTLKTEVQLLVDSADKRHSIPDMDQSLRCDCGSTNEPEVGFGLAGGGYGPYTHCIDCGNLISKSTLDDEDN